MHAVSKKAALPAALMLAAATLTGCVVRPVPYYDGGEYYAEQRPIYVQPRTYYGARPNTWQRHRWHGGWHGNKHHWDDDDD